MERCIRMGMHAASCTPAVMFEKGRRLEDFPVRSRFEQDRVDGGRPIHVRT